MSASGAHLRRVALDGHGYDNFTPTFSNNGRRILYTRCRPDPPGGCAIYSIRADGTGRRPLTHYRERIREGEDFFPAVSPNGRLIAFTRFDTGGVLAQVWVMRSDGARAHSITPVRLEGGQPRWTPDGRHLLIVNNAAHLGDSVYRVRPDGSRLHLLTTPRWPNNDLFPAPSSRGDRIAFASDRTHRRPVLRGALRHAQQRRRRAHGQYRPAWGRVPGLGIRTTPARFGSDPRGRSRASTDRAAGAGCEGSDAAARGLDGLSDPLSDRPFGRADRPSRRTMHR